MENKMKVKELATELKMDVQDMLRDLHGLSITAKSTQSTLGEAEVAKIRSYYKNEHGERSTLKTTDGGIIVRRRKQSDTDGADQPEATEASASTSSSSAPVKEEAPKVAEKVLPKEEASAPKQKEKAEEKPKAKPAKQKPAEIVSTPARVIQPAPKAPVQEAVPAPAPTPIKEEKVEEKPVQEIKKEQVVEVAQTKEAVKAPEVKEVKEHTKEHNKEQNKEHSKEHAKEHGREHSREHHKEQKPDQRRNGAAVSAKPDGSSTQSLLPPAGERSFAQRIETPYEVPKAHARVISKPVAQAEPVRREARDNRDQPRDQQGQRPRQPYSPRPDQPRYERKDGAEGNREPRENRGPRPDNRPGDNRPQGPRGPRPENRDMAGKDKDDANKPRPQRPMTPRPRPAGEGIFPVQEEQSRKKKNKNKKSGDFQSEPAATQDFRAKFTSDFDDDAPRRRRKAKKKEVKQVQVTAPMKAAKRKLRIDEAIRVSDMAHQMGLKASEIIKILFGLGVMATINSALDIDTATVVAAEFDYEVEKVGFSAEDAVLPTEADSPEQLKPRPPVVTIMGHVDHGKTSLLDAVRKTNVTAGEAGGITQHIGAYHVRTKRGEVVFLDTPGHEAFTAMRLRGAMVTDLVILVVAADDGVMEQTREAINHAKAAQVPIIVAINKMDKEGANPDRVMRELAELGLQSEEWGGDTVTAKVSAKKREGLDELLELVLLQAEIMELKANPDKQARGRIVEAKLDKGRGPVASVLIQEGTIQQGDAFVCGVFSGRVRALFNDQGKKIQKAGPSMPVEVQGFEGVPEAGEEFICLQDEKMARRIADSRSIKQREKELAKESRVTLETFLSRKANAAEAMVLNLVVKADVQGSLEAIIDALHKLSTEKVRINIIHGGAGSISESDIMLAAASEAIVIGFNVRPTAKVKEIAEAEQVDIRFYDIIYKLVEEIRSAMAGLLAPVQKEVYLGQAEVRETFTLPKVGAIAGSYIVDGKVLRNAGVRLLRDGVVIYTGKITSLKRFKDDAKEVLKGFECGISLENYNDIKVADIIEAFEMKEEAAVL